MATSVRTFARLTRKGLRRVHRRITGFDPVGEGSMPRRMIVCSDPGCSTCTADLSIAAGGTRIVFLLPASNTPTGGNKVSYRQCQILADNRNPCFAFHPEQEKFTYTWFEHHVDVLYNGHFSPRRDFLVFSEMWAALAEKFCVPNGIRYAIYVQNGYLAHNAAGFGAPTVRRAYEHADIILSISTDTTEIITLTYPFVDQSRILRLFHSVPPIFKAQPKEPLITYMPRKLKAHSDRLRLYLENVLSPKWQLQAIDHLDERAVAELLSRSSIFLSFSELEGCPLPPLEAAISGNIVVGYSGQGAKEYFAEPIFREVPNGDFILFVSEVQRAVADAEANLSTTEPFVAQAKALAAIHSQQNETRHLMEFAAKVTEIMRSN